MNILKNWIVRAVAWLRVKIERVNSAITFRSRLLMPGGSLRLNLSEYFAAIKAATAEQRGAISVQWLEGIFVGVILLVVLVTFLWQQGIPEIISATSNTTAMTEAGATSAQISWVGFIGGAIVIFLLIGTLIIGIRVATGGSGGGGGGGRAFRRRRKR
jgi:hypothetical protein